MKVWMLGNFSNSWANNIILSCQLNENLLVVSLYSTVTETLTADDKLDFVLFPKIMKMIQEFKNAVKLVEGSGDAFKMKMKWFDKWELLDKLDHLT